MLVLLAICVILGLAAMAHWRRALLFRSRILLALAMAPGNGWMPRPRLWARTQTLRREADALEAEARARTRYKAALRALATTPQVRILPGPMARAGPYRTAARQDMTPNATVVPLPGPPTRRRA